MKKIIAVLLALTFVLAFVGCKKEETPAPTSSVENRSDEIASAVAEGKIPEAEYKLGEKTSTLSNHYTEIVNAQYQQPEEGGHVHGDGDVYYDRLEGDLSISYAFGVYRYYYEKEKSKNGVSVIVSTDNAFGFKQGSSRKDVEDRLSSLKTQKLNAGEDELYFVPLSEALILRYVSGKYQLDFYFYNNELVATVLRDTENWTI